MTVAATDREVKELIKGYHVYGAEVLINALARATKDEPYLKEDDVIRLVKSAYKRIEEEDQEGGDDVTG